MTWLVRPDDARFFSLGVCCVDQGIARDQYRDEWPGYAAWRTYEGTEASRSARDADVAFTPVLHVGSTAGATWCDLWDPSIMDRLDLVARERIRGLREDRRLLGYYSDNEVVARNLNARWSDGSIPRFQLDTLNAVTGRPVLASEYYLVARENRSGNENRRGFPVVDTQRQRAAGFRRTIESSLRIPYVVGADWFQYYDEPTFGRADGENYSFGLVDIHDRPCEALVEAAAGMDCQSLRSARRPRRADASQGVPAASEDALSDFELHRALPSWDREAGFVRSSSACPLADLNLASTFRTHCRAFRTDWRGRFWLGTTGIRPPPTRSEETSSAGSTASAKAEVRTSRGVLR